MKPVTLAEASTNGRDAMRDGNCSGGINFDRFSLPSPRESLRQRQTTTPLAYPPVLMLYVCRPVCIECLWSKPVVFISLNEDHG